MPPTEPTKFFIRLAPEENLLWILEGSKAVLGSLVFRKQLTNFLRSMFRQGCLVIKVQLHYE